MVDGNAVAGSSPTMVSCVSRDTPEKEARWPHPREQFLSHAPHASCTLVRGSDGRYGRPYIASCQAQSKDKRR